MAIYQEKNQNTVFLIYHSAYDYARLMWIAVGKQCALPVYFLREQQFDICYFRSVMKGLLQLKFELRRSFCINCKCKQ